MARVSMARLRVRLLLLVLLAVVPALGLTLYTHLEERQREAAQVQHDALRLARLVSASQESLIEGARHLLVTLAGLPVVRAGDHAACNALFSDLLRRYPAYANFGVANAAGDIVCPGPSSPSPTAVASSSCATPTRRRGSASRCRRRS
ncbi:MAG: hypothetical protein ACRELA_01140 [Candidatus Rokuibacteriota bacterium]